MQKYADVVLDNYGNAIYGASIIVTTSAGAATTVYSDNSATVLTQPFNSGTDGAFAFYAVDGRYTVVATYGNATATITDIVLEDVFEGFADGTEALPSISNIGDLDTGWYFPAANTLAASTGGVERLRINSAGNLTIEGVTTAGATGTGALVFANSPALVNPALGTPVSGDLSNCTGLPAPIVTGILSVLQGGTGVALSTGSTAVVLQDSPTINSATLVTPVLGTPVTGTLTTCTGLPISTGVSGLGTGVATALAVNVGTAGAPVINSGVLGTPSSGTLTNCTGLPAAGVTGTALVAAAIGTTVQAYDADLTTWAGITPGSNVGTALAVNVGTAGAFVVNGGVLGTPSSGTITNLSGTSKTAGIPFSINESFCSFRGL